MPKAQTLSANPLPKLLVPPISTCILYLSKGLLQQKENILPVPGVMEKDLATGRIFSTTAQTYSQSAFPPSPLSHSFAPSNLPLFSFCLPFFFFLPPVGFSCKLPSPLSPVPPHRPSHYRLPPFLNQLHQLS
jgi:hypothetical protein